MSTIINGTSSAITFPDSSVQNTSAIVSGYVPYANLPAGSVLQVVYGSYSTENTTTSSAYSDTGLTATITPKYSTSKILVIFNNNGSGKQNNDTRLSIKLLRGSTTLITSEVIAAYTNSSASMGVGSCSGVYLDSPSTTSATTYKTQFSSVSNVATAIVQWNGSTSTITLMEIAG